MEIGLYLCLCASLFPSVWSQDPLVLTRQGLVRGSLTSGGYSEFLGITYAIVDPENPFGSPLPAPSFEGIFEAHDDGAICPQREEFNNTIVGSLDCLHVNVYVPSTASSKANKLPVMVWIYGGGFSIGFAGKYIYGPQYLVRHDVILVTLNYRLGPYGFMCLDIPSVPGNAGLKDQQAALRWVHENIEAFGGDVTSITIFGESAGGASVELQTLSPGSRGLFSRAITQSGVVFIPGLMTLSKTSVPLELAKQLGFQVETAEEAIQIISNVNTNDIIQAAEDLGLSFRPCVEKTFDEIEGFLTESPLRLLASGDYYKVPMLQGYNSDERLGHLYFLRESDSYLDQYQNIVHELLSQVFVFESQQQLETATKFVQDFYFDNKVISKENIYDLINFDSDFSFLHPTERSSMYHFANTGHPVYKYVLGYNGGVNFWKVWKNITEGGTSHADDVGFLFKQIYMPDVNSPEDQLLIDRVTTMWTNFAKHGDPTPETTELLPVRWEPVTKESRNYLWIDSDLKLDQTPFQQRMVFWDLFFEVYGEYYWMV